MAAKRKRKLDPLADDFVGPLKRVYLIHGNEHADVARAVRRLVNMALEGEPTDNSTVWLDGASATSKEIRAQVQTVPFLTPKRVVVVQNANKLLADEQEALADHLESLPETALLILEVRSDEGGHGLSKAFAKAVTAVGEIHGYAQLSLRSGELPKRVKQLAEEYGKSMSPSTCQYLLQRTGADLNLIRSEIAKLATYVEPGKSITNKEVDALVTKSVEESVFQMTDAVAEGRLSPALRILGDLLDRGEPPERLLPLLQGQYQLLRQAKFLMDSGYAPNGWRSLPEEVAARLPAHPNVVQATSRRTWLAEKVSRQARRLTWGQLVEAPQLILTADLQLKGADGQQRDRRVILETLVCQLCPARR